MVVVGVIVGYGFRLVEESLGWYRRRKSLGR